MTSETGESSLIDMRSENEQESPILPEGYRELRLLSEVDYNPEITQRQLSTRLGIALGLTNLLLRNLAQKGYLRATQAGWKRWVYAITPEGFSHKIRLTVGYISRVLDHYRTVRQTIRKQMEHLAMNEESRIAMLAQAKLPNLSIWVSKRLELKKLISMTWAPLLTNPS